MGFLFLDIETYIDRDNENSSLNPYEKESKVIVISYSYYPGFDPPKKEEINKPTFLKEWNSNEKEILTSFYRTLSEIQSKDRFVKFVGFNILKFDLPYLFGRMKLLNIATEKELYKLLFRPFGLDMLQISAILPEETIPKQQLWSLSQRRVSEFFGLKTKEGEGKECSRWYDNKNYDKIMAYCSSEFNFEQMLDAFYLHAIKVSK